MTYSYVWHQSFTSATRLVHSCDTCESFKNVRHDLYTHKKKKNVTWHIHTCDISHSHLRRKSFTAVTWHVSHLHMCDVTHSHICDMKLQKTTLTHMRQDIFICVTCVIHEGDMSWLTCVTWLMHIRDMTSYMGITASTWLMHVCAVTHSRICDMTDSNLWHKSFRYVTRHLHMSRSNASTWVHDRFFGKKWAHARQFF